MTKAQSWFSDYIINLRQNKSCFNTQLFHVFELSAICLITNILLSSNLMHSVTYHSNAEY